MTRGNLFLLILLGVLAQSGWTWAQTAAQNEFFETHIRPVLVDQCYNCHNSAKLAEGELAVDSRAAMLKGGEKGLIIVPGKPQQSRLIPILRHEVQGLRMPKRGGKLDEHVIADFEKWIAMGAPDPRDKPPSAAELDKATSWETILAKRKLWWSFQPIRRIEPPVVAGNHWSDHPADRFVLATLKEKGLEPGEPADSRTVIRRLYFALIGLPPEPREVEHWTARLAQKDGYAELVDHLLASPHFGERWARHWMDWVRYADSHGSEGDPAIDNAWMYRDYLIRALNADVPFDQLVREDIAGDLLEQPRVNNELGINESMIGPAQWRMVFHGFAPTDALEEKVRFIDDEINTFSKAFLGLTVSCARCHDHKFDAISQRDYYALFGILGSCRPARVAIDTKEKLELNRDKLAALKPRIRSAIADAWLDAAAAIRAKMIAEKAPSKKGDKPPLLLSPWFAVHKEAADPARFEAAWQQQADAWKRDLGQRQEYATRKFLQRWNFSDPAIYATWFRHGSGLPEKPVDAGEFSLATSGAHAIGGIHPGGVYSNTLTAKSPAVLSSRCFHLDDNEELWLRVIGDGGASARYVVQDYPNRGTVYPVTKLGNTWQWQKFDLAYWTGDDVHIELTAGRDAPLMVTNEARSWFGIREAMVVHKGDPSPPETQEILDPLFEAAANAAPKSLDDLAGVYIDVITGAVKAWQAGTATDAQALLLDSCIKQGILPNALDQLAAARPLVEEYRKLEEEIVVPTRVPGLEETVGRDQPLFERGNHKKPGDLVPRRFLEAIDATPYKTTLSGRRQLAEDVMRDDNPLTRRVIVNRIWHHLFGRGIVPTPDNFGKLGLPPTHPELLDYLAMRFKNHGGSMKDTIRFIVMSQTWRQTSRPSPNSQKLDPDNQYLSHMYLRRMEAEGIRDSMLAVSGTLSPDMYGASDGGNSSRRSVYVAVRRTALDPFLRAFDFPEPFSATGRRDATNVPAQSLTMMNDPHVASLASAWAERILSDKTLAGDEERLGNMVMTAFGRPALAAEIREFQTYIAETRGRQGQIKNQIATLRRQIDEQQETIRGILEPTRTRLLAAMKNKPSADVVQVVPTPIGRWDFSHDLRDLVGSAHGQAHEGAQISGGALALHHREFVTTAPLTRNIREKTLEAWVQLDNLDQRGGGVMTIQTPNGAEFDSIVFAEKDPGQWLSGSNFFQRTQSFNAPPERDAAGRAVHIAIAYHADGQVVCYRDGQPYGKPYQSHGPLEFKAGQAVIGFGIRHLPGGGNKMLAGRILRAQLYDRALTADEVRASSQSSPAFVSESEVLAELSDSDREKVSVAKKRLVELEGQVNALGSASGAADDKSVWADLARAMFTFKEFIYLK